MNKFKRSILRFRATSLKFFISLLGLAGFGFFVSCIKVDDPPVAVYGVPYFDNNINFRGNVISEETHDPIPGIKIKFTTGYHDTVYVNTDALGNYSFWEYATEGQDVKLILSDIDSTDNGGDFETKSIDIVVSFRDINNSEHKANVMLKLKP